MLLMGGIKLQRLYNTKLTSVTALGALYSVIPPSERQLDVTLASCGAASFYPPQICFLSTVLFHAVA